MGGGSNSPSVENAVPELRSGCQIELFKTKGAQLYLLDGEASVLMQTGDFSLHLIKQANSLLAAVVASVGDVQWPVGKDSPVFKSGKASYTLALPGIVYGLKLLESTPSGALHQLEALMLLYSTFEVHPDIETGMSNTQVSSHARQVAASEYWTAVAANSQSTVIKLAGQIGQSSTVASGITQGGDWAASNLLKGSFLPESRLSTAPAEAEISPQIKKQMQKARRLSAVAKLFSKILLKGTISASDHVARHLGRDVGSSTSSFRTSDKSVLKDVAVASVDAFAKVVDVVELAGKSVLTATGSAGSDLMQSRYGDYAGQIAQDSFDAVGNMVNTAWTLNKMGLLMLLRIIAASTVINIGRGSSVSSFETGQTSSTGSQQSSVTGPVSPSPAARSQLDEASVSVQSMHMPKQLLHTGMLSMGSAADRHPPLPFRPPSRLPKPDTKRDFSAVD
ncbi:hypothetical protein O6H91_05G119400 [Diphasiastrum complanatum]|uniref:Uncharacterized protein n=1 Tax=Diphasiastrum complanatum TaxID=34168 RepID=A0ACC2DSF4_DIPCM|nr:hypothetical protein O6H91_05G119400 [Diphasiastrum complanatum]